MAKKDNNLEKNNTAPVTPEVTDTKEAVTENSEAPAQAVIENHATEALKDTVVKVSDDDAREVYQKGT